MKKLSNINMVKAMRNLTVCCLVLFAWAENTMAQTDGQFVIKKGGHYLAHVQIEATMLDHQGLDSIYWYWVLRDVTVFHPDSCLWYSGTTFNPSGTNHNYYFYDGTNYRFLAAPLEPNGQLSLSDRLPSTSLLRNTDQIYYFFDWDPDDYGRGVSRGKKHEVSTEQECTDCNGDWHLMDDGTRQCWQVYWVALKQDADHYYWELSTESSYNITTDGGRFRSVAVTPHPQDTSIVEGSGLADLEEPFEMEYQENPLTNHPLLASVSDYEFSVRPEYTTYAFEGSTHNFYNGQDQGGATPSYGDGQTYQASSASYSWTITNGSTYLSFASGGLVTTSNDATPTLYYIAPNNEGHRTATLTLTVTYGTGADAPKQVKTTTVTVKTPCQNPSEVSATVNNLGAIISWAPTAESYVVSWKKYGTSVWSSATVSHATSYTITGLEYGGDHGGIIYEYSVKATCDPDTPTIKTFTTVQDPGLLVAGAIFGGGRMADVDGKTEVVIINCGSIDAVYGGNDIAGSVVGADGSTITLGVNDGGPYDSYGVTDGSIRVGSVYGGGNGYYAYSDKGVGVSFVPASNDYDTIIVFPNDSISHMSRFHKVGSSVYTNEGTENDTLAIPRIVKTSITVTNDMVKVDSIFGGAKNAFLTTNDGNGSTITINGGTILAVFGGNNWGGTQGYGKHHIDVTNTKTKPTATSGYGHEFGIGYLFGGGNKVYGSTTEITITGGQCDTVFAGGNSASVYAANVTVNCGIGENTGTNTYGSIYTKAIDSYTNETTFTVKDYPTYRWDGSGVYNVRTLFGGNNKAEMEIVPTVTLTSGSLGTVYGGGNAGDMLAQETDDCTSNHDPLVINEEEVKYSTHVILNQPTVFVDYLYGGCQMSNVDYSTWVQMQDGHVGTVYGGCNVSGDVGSTRVNTTASSPSVAYQEVQGGTFVVATGGTVYKDLFAGSNGYYHCSQDGVHYSTGINYDDPSGHYIGMTVPTHNETHVVVKDDILVKGNVYAGGNLACVGFLDVTAGTNPFPWWVGFASVRMSGGTVKGNVFGGGNMASIYGSNEVQVSSGTIEKALYGGNDRTGQVAQFSNRVLPSSYEYASDLHTSLKNPEVHTYISLTGDPEITTVYGGGNGYYAYFTSFDEAAAYHGPLEPVVSCNADDAPIQTNTFVDVNINGGANGGHIGSVYGGGDGVTVTGFITVFFNVDNPIYDPDHNNVETIFGGNNKGDLCLVPDIILLNGQVNTVYGGCNQGAMTAYNYGDQTYLKTIGDYPNIGSYVRLRASYDPDGEGGADPVTPNIKIMDAVYGGCRMNGVWGKDLDNNRYSTNSLVLVEDGDFSSISIFGGSDISGHVSGWSRVAVTGGTVGNVYGGGNGNYYYADDHHVYEADDHSALVASNEEDDPAITAPTCANSGADIMGGYVGTDATHTGNVFGGGYGQLTRTTDDVLVNVGRVNAASAEATPLIYGAIYGGSALGSVNTITSNTTTVNFLNGTIHGNVYGGGLGAATLNSNGYIEAVITEAIVRGTVHVNIGNDEETNYSNYLNIDGSVFGGNNLAGSPEGPIYVDVYRTAHTADNTYPTELPNSISNLFFEGDRYALSEVYGGGNLAKYTGSKANVHVHNCDNTIEYVYGGGNAADVTELEVIIDGGLVKYVFGGGNGAGTGNPGANVGYYEDETLVGGNNTLTLNGGVMGYVFAGSNTKGGTRGETTLQFREEPYCNVRSVNELYGGGNNAPDEDGITLNVPCGTDGVKVIFGGAKNADVGADGAPANITLNIYGGDHIEEVYGGNNQGGIIWGNVTLNLYGGTIIDAYGGNDAGGNIKGQITVNVIDIEDCPLDVTNVYGGGNHAEYIPADPSITSPLVNVMHIKQDDGVRGNVFGGGNEASVMSRPRVNIGYVDGMSGYLPTGLNTAALTNFPRAYVTGNVFGGGNNINGTNKGVEGNTDVYVYNGQVCQSWGNAQSVGIYGGCNTSGTVTGNVHVTLVGGTVGNATTRANIHGGGFGENTDVHGSVTVTFGEIAFDNSGGNPVEIHNEYPKLYGDLYGGSALGNVNTNNSQTTEVNILNGEITGIGTTGPAQYGYVFGGGLGRKAGTGITPVPALVKGVVKVNVGEDTQNIHNDVTTFRGMADLMKCKVFGCNNMNGTPLANVYVDVYKTSHPETNTGYAIVATYGGGNQSDYDPNLTDNPNSKAHVYIHSCDNTIQYVYGGGDASAAYGVETLIEGGRFGEIYGGGNGIDAPANIGLGGIGINVNSGHVNFLFEGSNHHGSIAQGAGINIPEPPHFPPAGEYIECEGELIIDSYYFGDNEAEHYGDLVGEITCEQADNFNYKYVFAGSRWAIVYGDIKLTVKGGNIQYLFGGSKGDMVNDLTADVRRFPSYAELAADAALPEADRKYSDDLKTYMGFDLGNSNLFKSELVGRGGNIVLTVQGGTIGDIIGGCDELGNVEGKITVIIDEIENTSCPLVIGNVYGASNRIDYAPINDLTHHVYFEPGTPNVNVVSTPQVKILKGTVGSNTPVTFTVSGETLPMEGNVYGGGNIGNITANSKVIVGESTNTNKVEVKGDVYGGGKQGDVNGSAGVIIVPVTHTLTIIQPEENDCTITVTDRQGNTINSDVQIDEYQDLNLLAIPSAYGYKFDHWKVANGSVLFEKASNTLFTMGTDNDTLKAIFTPVNQHVLTLTHEGEGAVSVTDGHGHLVQNGASIGEGAVLNLVATPDDGYAFLKWEVTGDGSSVANVDAATTTFTMGTAITTLKAVFVVTHTLTFSDEANGTVSVTDIHGQTVHSGDHIGEGATLYIVGTPAEGYIFDKWTLDPESGTITDRDAASTTYIMGNVNVELRGSFKLNN